MKRWLLKLWLGLLALALGLLAAWQYYHSAWPWQNKSDAASSPKTQRLRVLSLGPVWCIGKYGRTGDHPTVKLERAEFVSPATITPGSLLEVRAYTNKPVRKCRMELTVSASPPGDYPDAQSAYYAAVGEDKIYLWDDGKDGDATARDGEWYGALTVDLDKDCILTGMVCIYFDDYDRQYSLVENQVDYDAPGDDALSEEDVNPEAGQ